VLAVEIFLRELMPEKAQLFLGVNDDRFPEDTKLRWKSLRRN